MVIVQTTIVSTAPWPWRGVPLYKDKPTRFSRKTAEDQQLIDLVAGGMTTAKEIGTALKLSLPTSRHRLGLLVKAGLLKETNAKSRAKNNNIPAKYGAVKGLK